MNDKNKNSIDEFLCHGSCCAEHEDYLIGNEEGLKKLSSVINDALENGVHSEWIGEFAGVKCLENSFFEESTEENSRTTNIILLIILISILVVFCVGFFTSIQWIISLF